MAPTLRASCDSCKQAKVKCSKTRPHCTRCQKNNTGCVYGISLRAGKRVYQYQYHQQMQHIADSKPETEFPHFQDSWNWELSTSTPPYTANDAHTPLPMFGYAMPSQSNGYVSIEEPVSRPDLAYTDPLLGDFPPASNSSPALSPSDLSSTPAMPIPSQSSCSQSLPTTQLQACACFQTLIMMLSTLQQLSGSIHTSFDETLAYNREAVLLCLSTLRCKCARENNVILLTGSLIAKTSSAFEKGCENWESTNHSTPYQDSAPNIEMQYSIRSHEETLKRDVETLTSYVRGLTSHQSVNYSEWLVCEGLAVSLWEKLERRSRWHLQVAGRLEPSPNSIA